MKTRQLVVLLFAVLVALSASIPVRSQGGGVTISSALAVGEMNPPVIPWDSVLDAQGKMAYFTASGHTGATVFSVPASGGTVKPLDSSAPLVSPLGITISSDNKTLYVADPLTAGANGNAIYAIPVQGGKPALVKGTWGTVPHGVTLISEQGIDQLYYTGINLANGQPAVLKIAAAGADSAAVISKGSPLVAPSGLTVAKDGAIYVLDRLAAGNGLGSVFRIKDGKIDKLADQIRTGGELAGVALTLDESILLVSELDPQKGTAQVRIITLSSMNASFFSKFISERVGAGGLQRSRDANLFSWADSSAGPNTHPVIIMK